MGVDGAALNRRNAAVRVVTQHDIAVVTFQVSQSPRLQQLIALTVRAYWSQMAMLRWRMRTPSTWGCGMFVGDYEVWHTFGTWFVADFKDGLEVVAEELVKTGIAEVAHTSDGRVFTLQDDKVVQTDCTVTTRPSGQEAQIECDLLGSGLYSGEGVYQFAWMAYREKWLMSAYLHDYTPFVRALLNPIVMENEEISVVLYPQLKLYGNGVALLHFRLFAPDDGSDLTSLVNSYLNLFGMDVTKLMVPPSVLLQYDMGNALASITSRSHTKNAVAAFERHIQGHVEHVHRMDTEDFSFGLVDIPREQYLNADEPYTFGFVRDLYMTAIARVLAPKRQVFRECGNYWSSRPTVFLFDYTRQPAKFRDEDDVLSREFTSILLRVDDISPQVAAQTRLDNLRMFDDCRWYIGEAVNLLAFSREGAQSNREFADPNHGQLVYDKIVQVEAMEFIRYTHRKMLESSMLEKASPAETQADWRAVQDMESVLADPSRNGEITDTIRHYDGVMRLGDMRRRIIQSIEMQGQYAAYRRNQSLTALGIVATVVLGLSSIPTLTDDVTLPAMRLLGFASASVPEGVRLAFMLVTAIVLATALFVVWWFVQRHLAAKPNE
jgi:hypothetical protein